MMQKVTGKTIDLEKDSLKEARKGRLESDIQWCALIYLC